MRLLRKIIKASEYVTMKNGSAFPSNDRNLKPEILSADDYNKQENHRTVVKEAFDKAKQIMEAAQEYSINQVKESTQKMNEESAQILRESQEDGYSKGFAKGREEGTKVGYKEGYEDGFSKAQDENQEVLNELSEMIKTVETVKADIIKKYEEDIKKLSLEIAEKVIKREISIDEKAMQSIIINTMDSFRNEEWIRIIVSKNTKSVLMDADKSIIKALQDVSNNIKIEASPEMKDGDCTIDMPDRMIDAGVDTQLKNIKQQLQL